jgi:hypothetical protein
MMEFSEPSAEIKKEDRINLKFTYSEESEVSRVDDTYSRRNFFLEHGYSVSLPKNVNFDNYTEFTKEEVKEIIKEEMDADRAAAVSDEIQSEWEKNEDIFRDFFLTLSTDIPKDYTIIFTQYGVGGSYNPPNRIIINISEKATPNPFQTFIHEAIHCLIEKSIVQKYKLTQAEKESIVDYLMITSPAVQFACPRDKYQKFGPPSEELLIRVGLSGKNEHTEEVDEALEIKYNREAADFFDLDVIEDIEVVSCGTKDELLNHFLKYHPELKRENIPDYLVAFSPENKIYILAQDVMPAYENGVVSGPERYRGVLKHELVHKYLSQIPGKETSWLVEGVCSHVANQPYDTIPSEEITIDLLRELSFTQDGRKYIVGKNMIDRIVEDYGKEKLIEIIKIDDVEARHNELKRMFEWLK